LKASEGRRVRAKRRPLLYRVVFTIRPGLSPFASRRPMSAMVASPKRRSRRISASVRAARAGLIQRKERSWRLISAFSMSWLRSVRYWVKNVRYASDIVPSGPRTGTSRPGFLSV